MAKQNLAKKISKTIFGKPKPKPKKKKKKK